MFAQSSYRIKTLTESDILRLVKHNGYFMTPHVEELEIMANMSELRKAKEEEVEMNHQYSYVLNEYYKDN